MRLSPVTVTVVPADTARAWVRTGSLSNCCQLRVTVTAPSEIALYVRAPFEKLAELAVYRTEAQALISAAADVLN